MLRIANRFSLANCFLTFKNKKLRIDMAEIKTIQTKESVAAFITSFAAIELKRKDGFELLEIMQDFTGYETQMWEPTMIGFGKYHYKSDRSNQEGDWPLVGFSPRKAAILPYVYSKGDEQEALLEKLGKFKMEKGCIYVEKLADINIEKLKELMQPNN